MPNEKDEFAEAIARDDRRERMTAFVCGTKKCDHVWNGPVVRLENGGSSSCSKCGALAINVALWELP